MTGMGLKCVTQIVGIKIKQWELHLRLKLIGSNRVAGISIQVRLARFAFREGLA